MSNLLWKYFLEDDVDRFRNLLGNGSQTFQYTPRGQNGGGGGGGGGQTNSLGAIVGSPEIGSNASPRHVVKSRKSSGYMGNAGGSKGQSNALTKADLNNRDHSGLTLLHRVVSSTAESAISFALALIENPLVDIYLQDRENGWTALHRALYFGNVAIARALLGRDSKDSYTPSAGNLANRGNSLIKVKDNEGNSAFDVYNSTIARRVLGRRDESIEILPEVDDEDYDSEGAVNPEFPSYLSQAQNSASGDELFAFGSNKNLTLGFGDEDDRQHPERIILKRPDHLLFRFYQEHLDLNAVEKQQNGDWNIPDAIDELPTLIRNKPILIQDVALSKLHSALLTADLESNLYMCGFGPGGRLGTGDERTRFNYVCIEGGALEGRKVVTIALGQNHSIAVTSNGEVVTWGTNTWGTLGYSLPRPPNDEEPVNSTPRQIFGPLKKELVIGVAASPIHSVAHTSTSLYTWGKNEGQLGLMDSDSRSLEAQTIPRKVAASLFTSPIQMVSAINRATICLLKNHTVFVFANYGYNVVKFPLDAGFTNYHLGSTVLSTRYEEPSHISLITSGGDTIAAVSSRGDLFTLNVSQKLDSNQPATSTTNPAKIRSALSQPQRIWSLRKGNWDGIKSVGVGENGSVIICTRAGAVWRRVKRAKIKHVFASGTGDFKNKDFKFQRVPGLTNVIAVRSNVFGGYAAIRKDCDIMTQIKVDGQALWRDLAPLFSLEALESAVSEDPRLKELIPSLEYLDSTTQAVLVSSDIEKDAAQYILNKGIRSEDYDVEISTSLSETKIPVHGFMLAARGPLLRKGLDQCRENGEFTIPEMMTMVSDGDGVKIEFQGLDFITIFNLALYIYTDTIVDVWNYTKQLPQLAFRYRQIRTELMKLAANLGMAKLEAAVRSMTVPEICLNLDFASAIEDRQFFEDGDTIIELDGDEMMAHSALLRQRCPFFEGIFGGRAGGQWLHSRRELETDAVRIDLKHINPSTFDLILRYLYSDAGSELFDDVVVEDIDELCDLIMDVMSAADELMLDRLSQICQEVIGRFGKVFPFSSPF
jgi:alpha-tubulin suppressor-like RCC1 family protein